MKRQRNLQPSRTLTRASAHLQSALEALDALTQQDQDRLAPAMAADLNEAVGLIFEALERVAASGLVMPDGDDSGTMPQSAANLR
ncbi:DNA-binding GntR family transcriptional regulator [Azospirillum fermentarium]|uniref:hypothetical protein n=1 Tax=Azospirillum fermentarium TaxID=1233114 RepID=UPI0022276125|nr:hypothetical protein [Azospirillum fermentarium]MCW2244604.1 DNA-binding GntR family transcriptional regulator [Azospirillum fermentarium]